MFPMSTSMPQFVSNGIARSDSVIDISAIVDLVLGLIFSNDTTERDLRRLQVLLARDSGITLVPRSRTIFARTVTPVELMGRRECLFGRYDKWTECFRLEETDDEGLRRIRTNVMTQTSADASFRTVDILLAMREGSGTRGALGGITIVYDEVLNSRSPVTLFK